MDTSFSGLSKNVLELRTVGAIVLILLLGYGGYREYQLTADLKSTNAKFASSTDDLKSQIAILDGRLSDIKNQNNNLNNVVQAQESKSTAIAQQIGDIATNVGTLNKLQNTDPQLLQKYSKVYFLNEHYIPSSLINIPAEFVYGTNRTLQFHANAWAHLQQMIQDSSREGTGLLVESAYRSFGTQASLKTSYRMIYGAGTANQFSAEQGYSEHQLGTTIDFTTPTVGNSFNGFDKTSAYTWLVNNAYKYGFVLSYPKNNAYYMYEPWHWRFVGVALATKMHEDGQYFYNVDQREIDKYLVHIFD